MTQRRGTRVRVVSRAAEGPVLLSLLDWFEGTLVAEDKSPETIKNYLGAVRHFAAFCAERLELPDVRVGQVERRHIEAWQAEQLATKSRKTASVRHAWLKQFWKWCVEEPIDGVQAPGPMAGVRQPKEERSRRPVLAEGQLHALVKVCERDRSFKGRRDAALIRVLMDTGARRGGAAAMRWGDVDLKAGRILIRAKRGSGTWDEYPGRLGKEAVRALYRYRAEAEAHPRYRGDDGPLWLGERGPLSVHGIYRVVAERGREAGVGDVFPHLLRHSFAHYALADGISDRDLLALGGWRSYEVARIYGAALDAERALEAKKGKSLSDRF